MTNFHNYAAIDERLYQYDNGGPSYSSQRVYLRVRRTCLSGLSGKELAPVSAQIRGTELRQGWSDARESRKTKTPSNGDNRENKTSLSGDGSVANSDSRAHGLFNIHGSLYQQQIPNSDLREKKGPVDAQQGFPPEVLTTRDSHSLTHPT